MTMSKFTITAAGTTMIHIRVESGEQLTLAINGSMPDVIAREQIYALSMLAGLSESERDAKMDQAESLVNASMRATASR